MATCNATQHLQHFPNLTTRERGAATKILNCLELFTVTKNYREQTKQAKKIEERGVTKPNNHN